MNNGELAKYLESICRGTDGIRPDIIKLAAERVREMNDIISSVYISLKVGVPEFDLRDTLDMLEPFASSNLDAFGDTVPDALNAEKITPIDYHLSVLDSHPRIKANIESLWGTSRGRKYLTGLILDDRGRDMSKVQGFSKPVLAALNALLDIHDRNKPDLRPSPTIWDSV